MHLIIACSYDFYGFMKLCEEMYEDNKKPSKMIYVYAYHMIIIVMLINVLDKYFENEKRTGVVTKLHQ